MSANIPPTKNAFLAVMDKYAGTVGVFSGMASIGMGIYGAVESNKQWKNVNRKLDTILKNQEVILNKLETILLEVQYHAAKALINDPWSEIKSWNGEFKILRENAETIPGFGERETTKTEITVWVANVLFNAVANLDKIDNAIMGTGPANGESLMQAFAKRVTQSGSASPYYDAVTFFESLLLLQQQGIICRGNAYFCAHPTVDLPTMMSILGGNVKRNGISKFKTQAEHCKQYVKSLGKEYQKLNEYHNEGGDFVAFGISSSDRTDVTSIDAVPLSTDPGNVVVGFKLYGQDQSLMLKVAQAPFAHGSVSQKEMWIENWEHGPGRRGAKVSRAMSGNESIKNFTSYLSNIGNRPLDRAEGYLDIQKTEVPKGEVVTGTQLYYKQNKRIALRLQSAKLDADGNLNEASRHWTDSPPAGNREGTDYIVIRNRAKYISMHEVLPKPLVPVRGAHLFFHDDGNAYFVNVGVKTGIYELEDVWERYDMSTEKSVLAAAS
ncbi:MAG TPA: hypothetical protein VLL54_00970 [Pyrinomonadaceae bacterium]|nr:hypothetical protein [Pyrinomonadaceae bacterium]